MARMARRNTEAGGVQARGSAVAWLGGHAGSAVLLIGAIVTRLAVGLSSYSGAAHPPTYGDYEAQRHWMELTVNLAPKDWYREGPANNLSYWPLDYPPLSGYQLLRVFEPQAIALVSSRGYETYSSKQVMRWTVVLSDLAVYFPAAAAAAWVFGWSSGAAHTAHAQAVLAASLLQPALLLIDHAHFQYNGISLGLCTAAAAAIAAGWHVAGSVLYCLALNHKQMSLFYAPAFFGHLLGRCLQHPTWPQRVGAVAVLGLTVISTFAICWLPWMGSQQSALQVLSRIFPVRRGLYEDYLANFWCATSVAIKWKRLLSQATAMRAAAALTLLAAAPSMVQQIAEPTPVGLLLAMANSGLAFFMFSYQVHEKSILLPLLPVCLMAGWEPELALWGPLVAAFSMYPLLERDGASLAYCGALLLYAAVMPALLPRRTSTASTPADSSSGKRCPLLLRLLWMRRALVTRLCVIVAVALHAARIVVPAPASLPWLHDRALITVAYCLFVGAMLYLNWRQFHQCKLTPQQARHSHHEHTD